MQQSKCNMDQQLASSYTDLSLIKLTLQLINTVKCDDYSYSCHLPSNRSITFLAGFPALKAILLDNISCILSRPKKTRYSKKGSNLLQQQRTFLSFHEG